MNPLNDIANNLKRNIDDSSNRELGCRSFLEHVPELLTKESYKEIINIQPEYRGNSGDTDYVISYEIYDEAGLEKKLAYIWELKAPQCPIFVHETENRVKPSGDLIKAENQLLHYYNEQKGSEQFRRDFQVMSSEEVKFGGIIIGCQKTKIMRGTYTESQINTLYEKALRIRQRYFYDAYGIRLLNWDFVYQHLLRSTPEIHEGTDVGEISATSTLSISTSGSDV